METFNSKENQDNSIEQVVAKLSDVYKELCVEEEEHSAGKVLDALNNLIEITDQFKREQIVLTLSTKLTELAQNEKDLDEKDVDLYGHFIEKTQQLESDLDAIAKNASSQKEELQNILVSITADPSSDKETEYFSKGTVESLAVHVLGLLGHIYFILSLLEKPEVSLKEHARRYATMTGNGFEELKEQQESYVTSIKEGVATFYEKIQEGFFIDKSSITNIEISLLYPDPGDFYEKESNLVDGLIDFTMKYGKPKIVFFKGKYDTGTKKLSSLTFWSQGDDNELGPWDPKDD